MAEADAASDVPTLISGTSVYSAIMLLEGYEVLGLKTAPFELLESTMFLRFSVADGGRCYCIFGTTIY